MNITPVEHNRLQFTTGSNLKDPKLKQLSQRHPFTQQIDVIFPSNSALENDLETSLKIPRYVRGKISLAKVVEEAYGFVDSYAAQSGFSILSIGSGLNDFSEDEDVWCIDYRGVLTLSVCKDTYEKLGLVGKKVAFRKGKGKQGDGRHVISIPLYAKDAESVKARAKRDIAFKRWEERRTRVLNLEPGTPSWEVLCFSDSKAEDIETVFLKLADTNQRRVVSVNLQKRRTEDVRIPIVRLTPQPAKRADDEDEDWNDAMEILFEWVGMAGLGAQRLKANDRVDPFVALYDAPSPSAIGPVTHMCWTGFIAPSFVQAVIDVVANHLSQPTAPRQFVSVMCHTCTWSPVSYISPSSQRPVSGKVPPSPPIRDPTRDVEDSHGLVMVSNGPEQSSASECAWALAESLGKYDARWG